MKPADPVTRRTVDRRAITVISVDWAPHVAVIKRERMQMPAVVADGPRQLVSIIIPNFNHGSYLRDSIPRLLAQSWGELEIVVVDDGSTDESCAIVGTLAAADTRVRLIRLEKNVGIMRAVMRGTEEGRGTYIYCAAADDTVAPDFLERCVSLLDRWPQAAFCFSDPTELYEDGAKRTFPLFISPTPRGFTAEEMERLLTTGYFHFGSNTIVYRRSAFLEAGGFRDDLNLLSDWFVANVLALRYGACYVPEPLTYLLVRANSYSATNLRRTKQQRELFWRVLALLRDQQFADVAPKFRRAALLPEYRLRNLIWLLHSKESVRYLTGRLLARVITRGMWHYGRALTPVHLRRMLRRFASRWAGMRAGT